MSTELKKLIEDLGLLGYLRAVQELTEVHGRLSGEGGLPESVKEAMKIRRELELIDALRQQYDLYFQSSPEEREKFDS